MPAEATGATRTRCSAWSRGSRWLKQNGRVTLHADDLVQLLKRNRNLEALVRRERQLLEDERILLRSALHELALLHDKEPAAFRSRWLAERTDSYLKPREGGGWR